jgi:predicted MFS family arabinose efflux permease
VAAVAPGSVRVDLLGAVLITAAVALVVVSPGEGASNGWTSMAFWLPLLGGIVLLGAFVWVESRVAEPLVRLGFFRRRTLCAANFVTFVAGAMTGAGYLMLTMYLQQVLGYGPVEAGLAVAPTGVVNVLLGRVIGKLVTRFGVRAVMTVATTGAAACLAGLAAVITPHQGYPAIALVAVPMGMFFLLTTVTATIGATAGVADNEQGLAGGLRQTSLQLGIALGVATLLSIAASRTHTLEADGTGRAAALIDGFRLSYLILTGLTVLAALVGFLGFLGFRTVRPRKDGSVSGA